MLYIKEIHSTDGWQVKENEQDRVLHRQHRSLDERIEVGRVCMTKLALEMPALVDELDDGVTNAYTGMPERLYLIGADGRIAYKSGIGPVFFLPEEWERAIRDHLRAAS